MNQYGLDRYIPADVKRIIRQTSRFACVMCGGLPYTYEHFDPPFKDAKTHDPDGMALLCGNCQIDKSAGRLSGDQVRSALRNLGRDEITWTRRDSMITPTIRLGTFEIYPNEPYYPTSIAVNETPLLAFIPPAEEGHPWSLSAALATEESALLIRRDELIVNTGAWDITFEGKELTIRSGHGRVDAKVIFDPKDNSVSVVKLVMPLSNYWRIDADSSAVIVSNSKSDQKFQMGGMKINTSGGGFYMGLKHQIPHPHTICFHYEHFGNWHDWTGRSQSEVEDFSDCT